MANEIPRKIEPDALYDFTDAARILRRTPNWLKKNFILNGKIPVVPAGQTYWIHGYALIDAVKDMQVNLKEDDETS